MRNKAKNFALFNFISGLKIMSERKKLLVFWMFTEKFLRNFLNKTLFVHNMVQIISKFTRRGIKFSVNRLFIRKQNAYFIS